MPRGRPPKPLAEKLLAGDPGKRLTAAQKRAFDTGHHPVQRAKPLTIPKTLTPAAAVIWKEIVASHPAHTYAAPDRHQLAAYCEAVATFQHATAVIAEEGYVAEGTKGQPVASPWVAIQREARTAIQTIGPTLHLTPTARAQMMKSEPPAKPLADPFDGLIQ